MGKKEIINILKLALLLIVVSACIPKGSEKKDADCASSDYAFDPVSRTCKLTAAAQAPKELPPVPTTTSATITEDVSITIPITYTDIDGDLASDCEILALSWSANLERSSPNVQPDCTCIAGSCNIFISPREDDYGPGSLFYRIRDANHGWSDYTLLTTFIEDRNDAPVISTSTTYSYSFNEDNDNSNPQVADTSAQSITFNLCNEIANTGPQVTDVDSVTDAVLEVVTDVANGSLSASCENCNCGTAAGIASCSCTYTFPAANDFGTPIDTFTFRFKDTSPNIADSDLYSGIATFELNAAAVNDIPADISNQDLTGTPFLEDTAGAFTLATTTDVDDTNLYYEIATDANCNDGNSSNDGVACNGSTYDDLKENYGYISNCLDIDGNGEIDPTPPIAAVSCTFVPYHNVFTTSNISIYYRARDGDATNQGYTNWARVDLAITPVNDLPFPFFGYKKFSESKTALASEGDTFTFDLSSSELDIDAYDIDGDTVSYSIDQNPADASVVSCMSEGTSTATDVNCTVSMDDDNGNKNTSGTPVKASNTVGPLTVEAIYPGSAGNFIEIEVVAEDLRARNHPIPTELGCSTGAGLVYATCPAYFDHLVEVSTNGTDVYIRIYQQEAATAGYETTWQDVEYLLNRHPITQKYVSATGGTLVGASATGLIDLEDGTAGVDSDPAFVFRYQVSDGTAQTLKGFISLEITPTNDTPVFCRYSPYEEAPECGLLGCIGHETPTKRGITPTSHTNDRPIYFYDTSKSSCYRSTGTLTTSDWEVVTFNCNFSTSHPDCGGGDCSAAGSPVGLVTPSDHPNGVVIYQDSTSKACYRSTGQGSSDWEMISAGIPEIIANEGDIVRLDRIVMDEGGADTVEDAQQVNISNFVTTNNVLININNIRLKQKVDNRFIPCNFSKKTCDTGSVTDGDCNQSALGLSVADPTGQVTPDAHTSSDPIFYWANIDSAKKCYVSTGNTSADWVELIDNTQLYDEVVYQPANNSDPGQTNLFSAASGTSEALGSNGATNSADDDTYVLEFTPTSTENGESIISFQLDDGECQFTTSSETSDCGGGDCTGAGTPWGSGFTPTSHTNSNPIIWLDTTGPTCYKSVSVGGSGSPQAADWTQTNNNNAWPITTVYFKVTVNPVGASHTGWKNLSASGPVINKYDEVKSANASFCPYSKAKCNNGSDCIGTTDPGTGPFQNPPTVLADADYTVYYNSSADKCFFWDATLAQSNKWTEFTNYCNITQSEYATECFNGSCLFEKGQFTTDLATNILPTGIDNYYVEYDSSDNSFTCYQSFGIETGNVKSYKATANVKLEWENFNVIGSGALSGFNVYRRLAGEEFDYERPINNSVISSLATTFEDNASNSNMAPVPGTVYYYEVQPIVSGIRTRTSQSYSVARILAPEPNMTFVHRRIVNKLMCNLMGNFDTDVDQSNNNTCDYVGPGDNTSGKYDIGSDYLVSTFEAGCPYTADYSSCNTSDGNCIADRSPDDTNDNGTFFYSRNDGKCWYKDGVSWEELNTSGDGGDLTGLADMENIFKSELPPVAYFSQSNAISFCADAQLNRSNYVAGCPFSMTGCDTVNNVCSSNNEPDGGNANITASAAGIYYWDTSNLTCWIANSTTAGDWIQVGGDSDNSIPMKVPTRKEQIAFSFWDNNNLNDSTIVVYEQGLSLNSSSKCNSSSASGLTSGYTDSEAPDSNSLYSLPGTASSGIRSVATGVNETENCQSIFGARDLVGNLSEWSSDTVTCSLPYQCLFTGTDFGVQTTGASSALTGYNYFIGWRDGDASGSAQEFLTDGYPIGPCIDTDNDDICDDSFFGSWTIDTEANSAGRFIIPMGLPANVDFPTNFPTDQAVDAFFEIGPTSGITANQLHDDTVEINSDIVIIPSRGIAGGGSYLTGTGSGQWHMELVPEDGTNDVRSDLGFRCVMPIDNTFYTE